MGERIRRSKEWIGGNKAEAVVLGLGATALVWEAIAPDKSKDLISHAADRHQGITLGAAAILLPHLLNLYDRLDIPQADPVVFAGKRLGFLRGQRAE